MLPAAEPPETEVAEPGAHGTARPLAAAVDVSRRRRRRFAVGMAVAVVVLAAAAIVLSAPGSSAHHLTGTGVPSGDTTATVTRRTLSESSTVDGTLGYGSKLDLYDRLAGTFTWLPGAGAIVRRGGTLWRIDNEPIVLMYGPVPAYRTLKGGVSEGPDVAELNSNLIDLGYDPYGAITKGEKFSEATSAAVKRWQKAEGLTESGEVELGRIVFAPGTRRVTEVHVSLGQDPPGSEGSEAPGGEDAAKSPAAETPASKEPKHKEPARKKPARKTPPSKKPRAQSPSKPPASKPSSKASDGDEPKGNEPSGKPEGGSGAGELALSTTSTQQIVQLQVKAEQQQLARRGELVPVALPGGEVVHGRITSVGTVASEPKSPSDEKSPGGESEPATIEVTVALDRPVARLDQAPVSVELVKSVSRHVLTVPATALIATAGGGYAVEALAGPRRVALPVTPGMFAGGYVAVEGAGLRDGMTVIESQ